MCPKNRLSHPKSRSPVAEPIGGLVANNQNARAVRLLREGRVEEAVSILRTIVLKGGCTWIRPEVPNVFKRNYATALLLSANPSGCVEVLGEMRDESNPRVQQLRAAIRRWEKTLSLLQWLDWRTGWINPNGRPVTLDFEPGEIP